VDFATIKPRYRRVPMPKDGERADDTNTNSEDRPRRDRRRRLEESTDSNNNSSQQSPYRSDRPRSSKG
jgi:hypothetical protein